MIDEIVRKIYEEDQKYVASVNKGTGRLFHLLISTRELEARLEKRRATQCYIEEFKQKQEEVVV